MILQEPIRHNLFVLSPTEFAYNVVAIETNVSKIIHASDASDASMNTEHRAVKQMNRRYSQLVQENKQNENEQVKVFAPRHKIEILNSLSSSAQLRMQLTRQRFLSK